MSNDLALDLDEHSHTIIHIDLDCFYAQVEMIRNPSLRNVPLGIQQKSLLVTCNYIARECGVKKCTTIADAKSVCPNLVLINGEDLYDYRKISYQVTAYLQRYSPLVERLGLDENFVDVTSIVNDRIQNVIIDDIKIEGHVFGETNEFCQCGCQDRLKIGSMIAQQIRDGIRKELNLTSCAGIAHNKLLAKLVGSVHKPNQQTTIFPNSALELMLDFKKVARIPGVGHTMAETLERLNIKTIEDLHNCKFEELKSALTPEKAKWLVNMSYGRDTSAVKPSGKPQSIGLEDSCKTITAEAEIKEKFHQLLNRLIILVSEDGRIPTTIKVTIRKFDKISHRESRQCNISPNLFIIEKHSSNIHLNEQSENKLMSIIMNLFNKLVNVSQPYHITLLGLSFTKFQERFSGRSSIASYFIKDVAVQSITSIENMRATQDITENLPTTSQHALNTDAFLESEIEPSPKKSKITSFAVQHAQFNEPEYSSPSKLRVADLQLNSKESDKSESETETGKLDSKANESNGHNINQHIQCPPDADEEVFWELPTDVQQELWSEWKRNRQRDNESTNKPLKKAKTNTILNYFVKS
ncbi:hypothetical protein ILUMI_00671 [Ignelater luminosus]|uniref:UmuC domain-containing protein n=1 Tax=Ignelater luminosus TaxID=2038154 RepID=A0A8K0GI69_IGNLU|nr:hypothetical protein ILUMI_00671 [Ignelater luminosus]